jgi:hypothetical protein
MVIVDLKDTYHNNPMLKIEHHNNVEYYYCMKWSRNNGKNAYN